jgi:molybdopterin converting factor subunit 1
MLVRVRLFASLREKAGSDRQAVELPDGASVEDAWSRLARDQPQLAPHRGSLTVAVNRRYAPFDTRLSDGDEIAFIPPVSGG